MVTVTVTEKIAAPLETVFSYFTDIDSLANRVSGIKKTQLLTPGPFALGTRWLETREVMGRQVTEELQVTSFARNQSYTITNERHSARVDLVFTFERTGRGT